MGITADDAVALVIGVIDGRFEIPDLDVVGVVAGVDPREALEDLKVVDWLSDDCPAKEDAIGDWRRDDVVDGTTGESVAPVSSLVGAVDNLDVGVAMFWQFTNTFSTFS